MTNCLITIHNITILYLIRQIFRTNVRCSTQYKQSNYATTTTQTLNQATHARVDCGTAHKSARKTVALSFSIPVLVLLPPLTGIFGREHQAELSYPA
ncbi:MAG TPA: hypothetical protein VFC84_20760 [Desulfosporosinus sp.]|nr:hypothetical protein [Desulfosporosinus sp.]